MQKSHTTYEEHSRAESPGQRIIEEMTPEQRMASLKAFAEDRKMVYPGISCPAFPLPALLDTKVAAATPMSVAGQ